MDAIASGVLYAGVIVALVAGIAILKPIRRLGFRTRARAVKVCALGLALAVVAVFLPASAATVENHACKLDDFLPVYQFHEVHSTVVQTDPADVYAAIKEVTSAEIRGFRTLTWLRSPHFGPARASLLAAPADQPVLDVATRSGFIVLSDQAGQELVIGTLMGPPIEVEAPSPDGFLKFDRPGYMKVAMNFTVAALPGGGSSLFTETRVFATDAESTRLFAAYWRAILPGSSWIRHAWLSAIKARAERP